MKTLSIVNTSGLPAPLFSSGIFSHRDKDNWRAQVCVARPKADLFIIWAEYHEGFSENFEIIGKTNNPGPEYIRAVNFLKRRGYIVDSAKEFEI